MNEAEDDAHGDRRSDPGYHAKLDELIQAVGAVTDAVAEIKGDVGAVKGRMDGMDLNGSAVTLKAMAKPGGPVAALMAIAPEILNRMTYATVEQQELTDYSLAHAAELLPSVKVMPEMSAAYVAEKAASAHKERVRADFYLYLGGFLQRFEGPWRIVWPLVSAVIIAVLAASAGAWITHPHHP